MKPLNLFLLLLCLIEIYGQRIRTTNTNQDVSTQEPKTLRGRGRSRFSESVDLPQSSERPSSNRRASTRTRIHSNNPKAAAERRARPIAEASRAYAVEEINNDSPIDSFIRQSKPRVLTESRFEIPTVTVPRRTQNYQPTRTSPQPPPLDEYASQDLGFGSTARAILQARGEPLPVRTTTPVIDEAYLLNNFGSTIRSLVGVRNELPIQRATPLRSEVPIINQEDIPLRRPSLRGDPLPSLRGSDISVERQSTSSRGRTRGRAKVTTEQPRTNARIDRQRKIVEEPPVQEIFRAEPEAPESVQGIFEQSESLTEAQPLEAVNESTVLEEEEVEEEDIKKSSSTEVVTQKITEPSVPRQTIVNNRIKSLRDRAGAEYQSTVAPRGRALRTRAPQRTVEIFTASSRSRGSRRNYDDPEVAESRGRGPSVFTAEQYQEVTSRSRTGRRIDSKVESVPVRIPVDLPSVTTGRTRISARRPTTAGVTSTERSSSRDRSNSRGRSRSRASPDESSSAPVSRSTNIRRTNTHDNAAFYGDKTGNRAEATQATGRRETHSRLEAVEPRATLSRGNSAETSNRADAIQSTGRRETSSRLEALEPRAAVSRGHSAETSRRVTTDRTDSINSRSRSSAVESRRLAARAEPNESRNPIPSRSSGNRQYVIPEDVASYGERSSRTRTHLPQMTTTTTTTTTTTEEPTTILNVRSRSRLSELPPKIDESKLEVLPLFEREVKTVPSARSRGQRSRSSVNGRLINQDHMHVSATENDVKFVEKPTTNAFTRVTVTRTESIEASTSRARLSTRTASTTASTSTADTTKRTTPSTTTTTTTTTTKTPEISKTTQKWVTRSPPLIRESVVAEVNEVTSKTTFTRKKKVPKAKANEILSRGTKKSEVKLAEVGKKASSDEIGDEDNYPEPFKALIQAKKQQEDSRPLQASARAAPAATSITITEKAIVTSAASPRASSSTARAVTTESPGSGKRLRLVNEIFNDNENELDPKPTVTSTTPNSPTRSARSRLLPKFSEKPKYTPKPREKSTKTSTENPRQISEKGPTKSTATPKKTYSTKSYPTRDPVTAEHHPRRKALRSTALPPSTTPMNVVNREAKFSAKFIRKESKSVELNSPGRQKVSFNSKREESGKNTSVEQTPKLSPPFKKFNTSRYSSRYRSDPSQRSTVLRSTTSAPFYIPTIPTPAYIPTIPTVTPPVTPVGGRIAKKDKDLGLEVISFDDPVNTISSADLVNGEFLTTDKNIRLSPMVKDGTTEKAVSIIERIINSLTSISTTAVPNITTTDSPSSASFEATENSAILKLAPKKTTTKDKTIPDVQTNIIETITSEKPTTIIEKIRSSLSAIQSNEVGTPDFNTVSSSSTTPLSTVTKYSAKFRGGSVGTTALPAPLPLSTSINPLSVFDDIDENQVLEKRTIGKLLNILNGLVSTNSPEKLVVVTPKSVLNSGNSPTGFVATTLSSQEPLEAIDLNGLKSRASFNDLAEFSSVSSVVSSNVNTEFATSSSTVNTDSSTLSSIVNTESSAAGTETVPIELSTLSIQMNTDTTEESTQANPLNTDTFLPGNTEISTPLSIQTDSSTTTSDITSSTTISSLKTTVESSEASANPLSINSPTTFLSTLQESTTIPKSETTTVSDTITTSSLPQDTATVDGFSSSILYTFPSTIPTIPNIEVSPGSVSIFSANDLSNFITSDDNLFNTVTIASRVGFDNNVLTSTTSTSTSTTEDVTSSTVDSSTGADAATTEASDVTTMVPSATTTDSTTMSTSSIVDTTMLSTTVSDEATTMLITTMSSNMSNSNSSAKPPIVSNRSGRILSSDIGEPVDNSIDVSTPSTTTTTTPDYFIFAVLNNNTILRKRPPTIPNKDTPFIIVGLYPNNTVVRKFPNGTLIPMEQIIKVRGFDTRPNPPPLVEITSNQVTDTTNGMTTLDNNSVTVESNRMARLLENERTIGTISPRIGISSTTPSAPVSTTVISSTTSTTTTNEPKSSTVNSFSSTTSSGSTLMSSSPATETSTPSTTTYDTTMMFTSTVPSSSTAQGSSTLMSSNIVEIMAVPGETRISKPQTTTGEPSTVPPSTIKSSTTQAPTSTIAQTTETIPPTLGEILNGEILNGKTVNALTTLLTNAEVSSTKAPNFKTIEVNQYNEVLNIQDLISRNNGNVVYRWKPVTKSEYTNIKNSITPLQSTTELSIERDAPFTSPTLSPESTTQFANSADRLLSSTLISTLLPATTTAEPKTQRVTITSTTEPSTATTTTTMRTTTPEIKTTTQIVESTSRRLTTTARPQVKTTVVPKTTTGYPTFTPATILPSILTTLFPNLLRSAVTTPSSPLSTTRRPFTSAEFITSVGDRFEVLSTAGSTARPSTVLPQTSQKISTTTPPTTTTHQTTIQTTTEPITTSTTTQKPTTTRKPTPTTSKASRGTPTPSTKEETDALFNQLKNSGKLKNLNEEQRKNLEEIEKIEKEQAELLKQLSLLTTMFNGQAGKLPNLPPLPSSNLAGGNSNSLANRVIAMAMERDRSARSSTADPPTITTKKAAKPTTKRPNSIQDQLPASQPEDVTQRTTPSLEDILKQYNLQDLSTPVPLTSTYGKSDEALLAALLKEQGIGPTTPKVLGDKVKEAGIFEENPTTKPPKPKSKPKPRPTTTARPVGGRLMQGLNWLLDILDPPTTKRPVARKAKANTQRAKPSSNDDEILTNQPTRITPMVTAAPVTKPNLSQEEIQLEAVQNDPDAAEQLDFSKIKNLQNLINVNEGVQVTSAGQHGATSRATPRPPKISTTERDPFLTEINRKAKSSTVSTLSVSNSIEDEVELLPTTVRTRVLPPVSLNPIPGIDNQGDSLIRSNLLTAAVNVTRAISSFLGSALQDAASQVRSMFDSGTSVLTSISSGSSVPSIASVTGGAASLSGSSTSS